MTIICICAVGAHAERRREDVFDRLVAPLAVDVQLRRLLVVDRRAFV